MRVSIHVETPRKTIIEVGEVVRSPCEASSMWSLVRLVRKEWGSDIEIVGLKVEWTRFNAGGRAHLFSWKLDSALCEVPSPAPLWPVPVDAAVSRCARCLEMYPYLEDGSVQQPEPVELEACMTHSGRAEHLCIPNDTMTLCNYRASFERRQEAVKRCYFCERIARARSGGLFVVTASEVEGW